MSAIGRVFRMERDWLYPGFMGNKWMRIAVVTVTGVMSAMLASAADITISDGQSTGSGWYGNRENNETEPGTITSQVWDLEKMLIDGSQLTIQGGYDFRTGAQANGKWYRRGDILIDLNGDAKTTFNSANPSDKTSNGYFNYDFAIHFSTTANDLTYTIVDLNSDSKFVQVTDIQKSNPWRLDDAFLTDANKGINYDDKSGAFAAGFETLASDAEGSHFALTVDLANFAPLLAAIKAANEMMIKFTIECGNDTILGLAAVPSLGLASAVADAGTTLALFGLGLGGLALFRSRGNRHAPNRT
jgi:hypothetical protein